LTRAGVNELDFKVRDTGIGVSSNSAADFCRRADEIHFRQSGLFWRRVTSALDVKAVLRYLETTGKNTYPVKRYTLPCFESAQQLDGRNQPFA
jgi:hypothetical protein